MAKRKEPQRYSLNFGKKEKVLNYTCQTFQLSRPNRVGAVMSLIRECQPKSITEWEAWYLANAITASKEPKRVTKQALEELGDRLHHKITSIVIPEWEAAFQELTREDCIAYIYNLTISRTYDGYIREKSVVYDVLAKHFPNIVFEETPPELDHSGDVDYFGYVGEKAFGIQIKPTTAKANFGNYSVSERMKGSFADFTKEYSGKVFIIFSLDGEVANPDILPEIAAEVQRLQAE
jgi:hypothetical protein